jgi:Na+/H+-dicarboxylate symporter
MVNVTGDATVATIVAHQESQLNHTIYLDPSADQDGDTAADEPQTTGATA